MSLSQVPQAAAQQQPGRQPQRHPDGRVQRGVGPHEPVVLPALAQPQR